MNRKTTILILSLLALVAIVALAQERPNPKYALRWYPDGTYSRFGICEASSLSEAEAYPVYTQIFSRSGDSLFGTAPPLPKEFIEKTDYYCYAQITSPSNLEAQKMAQAQLEKELQGKKREEIDEEKVERIADRMKRHFESDRMWVFSIPELDLLIESSLKSNALARSGKKILGRPLYTFRDPGDHGEKGSDSNIYAWATAGGELLVADKPETILSMIAAGEGGGLRMIDNQAYSDVLSYINEFGQVWSVQARRAEKQLTLERLRDSAAEEAKIRELEEEIADTEIYDAQNIFVTDVIVVRSSKVYGTEEVAQEQYARQSGALKQASSELKKSKKDSIPEEEMEKLNERERRMVNKALGFASNLLESQETTIEGTVVTTTITFGKRQLRTLGQLMAFAEMMEKKEQEKEAREEKEDY